MQTADDFDAFLSSIIPGIKQEGPANDVLDEVFAAPQSIKHELSYAEQDEDDADGDFGFLQAMDTDGHEAAAAEDDDGDDAQYRPGRDIVPSAAQMVAGGRAGAAHGNDIELPDRVRSMTEDYALTRRALANKAVQVQKAQQQQGAGGAQAPASSVSVRMPHMANMLFREAERANAAQGPTLPGLAEGGDPSIVTFLRQAVTCLPTETVPAHLNPEGVRAARDTLRVSRRAHEESLLRTPGPGETPCAAGRQCVGRRIVCAGGSGETLVAYAYEGDDAPANEGGKCLLCMRKDVYGIILTLRAENRAMRPGRVLCSRFYNLVNVPGEYPISACIGPSEYVFEGLVMPVVKLDLCAFERVPDAQRGVVRFRQLLPVVGPRPEPVAEQLRVRQLPETLNF